MSASRVIAVVGATGGTGLGVVEQALAKGYTVRALVRNPSAFNATVLSNPSFSCKQGDVKKEADIREVLAGATDLVVALGGRDKNDTICSEAQPIINSALNSVNPEIRLVTVTSMAVGDSYHYVTWGTRRFADWVIPKAIADKNIQERAVIRDTVNWVIVRPAGLGNGPVTGSYEAGEYLAPAAHKQVARNDVAHFIVEQCLSGMDRWRRSPVTVGLK
jgi:uncharacterized protein YbjT (DUF2867 family)